MTNTERDDLLDLLHKHRDLFRFTVRDLSDEPVLGYRERMELAAVALASGLPYLGSDFRLEPPIAGPPLSAPTVAVGTPSATDTNSGPVDFAVTVTGASSPNLVAWPTAFS